MKLFTVAALGFPSSKLTMLEQAFSFTVLVKRARAYELVKDLDPSSPDIVLVNIESPEALATWEAYKTKKGTSAPPFAAVSTKIPRKAKYQIRLPFYAPRVLKVLDEISIKELKFVPEITIEDEDNEHPVNILNVATLPDPPPAPQEQQDVIVTNKARHTVLVVDGNTSTQKLMGLNLTLLKLDADYANDGESAKTLLQRNTYDAVFIEATLPDMSGYELCKSVHNELNNTELPVIMLADKNNSINKLRGKMAGCSIIKTKPLTHQELEEIAKEYIFSG